MKHISHAVHKFSHLPDEWEFEQVGLNPKAYSLLKFGSREAAQLFGRELAVSLFKNYSDILLSEQCVVIPSPYNYVKNAATLMTDYMYNYLNYLLVNASGNALDYSVINRKVSYTADYGFLPKEKRQALLGNDLFYVNKDYVKNKTIIFIDDVKITGTHEDKLLELVDRYELQDNTHIFAYYAQYEGDSPSIEAELNFYAFPDKSSISKDIIKSLNEGDSELLVRPVKYLMKSELTDAHDLIEEASGEVLMKLYHSCLAEGYYRIPEFQENFGKIQKYLLTCHYI